MPDFDAFERCVKDAMLQSIEAIDDYANRIDDLPSVNIPKLFKGRTIEELQDWLHKAHGSLRTFFPEEPRFTSSDDNRDGADLLEENTQRQIELKTGAVTDANAGLSTIAWTLNDDPAMLKRIMVDSAVRRRQLPEPDTQFDQAPWRKVLPQVLASHGGIEKCLEQPSVQIGIHPKQKQVLKTLNHTPNSFWPKCDLFILLEDPFSIASDDIPLHVPDEPSEVSTQRVVVMLLASYPCRRELNLLRGKVNGILCQH